MVTINSAEANRASIRYLPEVTWGTTPASGVTRQIRLTASSLAASKETKISDEIRSDRMVPSIAEVSAQSGGTIDGEFSAGTYDDFLEAFLLGAWSLAMRHLLVKGTSVTVTGVSEITVTGFDYTDWLVSGQFIKTEGFLESENNGIFTLDGVAAFAGGNTVITVTESSLVVEGGSAYTKVMDAADVISVATDNSFTSGNVITAGTGTPFSALVKGQIIHIDSRLGKETGTFTLTDAPVNAETLVVTDGTNTAKTYEVHTAAASIASGNVFVENAASEGAVTLSMHEAIMDQFRKQNSRVSSAITTGVKETGTLTWIAPGAVAADSFSVNDGRNTVTFTFVAGVGFSGTNIGIGASETDTGDNVVAALAAKNATGELRCTGANAAGAVTVTNHNYMDGALVEIVDSSTKLTVVDLGTAGAGTAPILTLRNHYATGGALTAVMTNDTTVDFSGGASTKSGFRTVASIGGSGATVTVDEVLDVDANGSSVEVVVKGSHLRNPGTIASITKQSFTIEQEFTDVSKYFTFDGMRVGSFNMSVASGEIASIGFDFQGREATTSDSATLTGGGYTVLEATNTEVMNATSNVGSVEKSGVALTQAVMELALEGDSNLRTQSAVGNKFPAGVGYGRFSLTGSMMVYFEDFEFYNIFINHQTTSLKFNFEGPDHFSYFFNVPAIKITDDPISPEGIDTDVMEEIEFQGFREPTINTQLAVDRYSSVWPLTF